MKNLIFILFTVLSFTASAQDITALSGQVLSFSDNKPLAGASVKVKGSLSGLSTDQAGMFMVKITGNQVVLLISYLGYENRELELKLPLNGPLIIHLKEASSRLNEVIVSTGYQEIPQERVTGSFVQVNNSLFNRRVSTDVLSRLENSVAGLTFNQRGTSSLSIRGQSTIYANAQPLIVLDNFPYEGDVTNINPNDVESITVLKDAAAASIWGARAGNGVIVITTRKGKYNQPLKVSFNSNATLGDKPDLFYQPKMSSADYIDTEQKLFARGFYRSAELSASRTPLTPVIELLIARRDGNITAEEADAQLEALKQFDFRNDLESYVNQSSLIQQYALSMKGGGESQRYLISGGYDHNRSSLVRNGNARYTLNANHTYSMLNQKLELNTTLYYLQNLHQVNNPGNIFALGTAGNLQIYPYARLVDDTGKPVGIVKNFRENFIQSTSQLGLLDWQYKPLEEIRLANNSIKQTDYRLNLGLKYKIHNSLNAEVLYQYGQSLNEGRNLQSAESFYTRDLVNRFTQINSDGSLLRPVPLGAIMDINTGSVTNQYVRGQLNYTFSWKEKHNLTAITGIEIREIQSSGNSDRLYGYDEEHAASKVVDYVSTFRQYYNQTSNAVIPNNELQYDLNDRFLSYYSNAAYTYNHRYTLSASGRMDKSNLFGVKTNQKGVPLYSFGLAWNVNEEAFYSLNWLPFLKARATYGYNGNIDNSLSAYTTARYLPGSISVSGLTYAQVVNPPNPELRWERVKMLNLGLDFGFKNKLISGTIEYYRKNGIDLIGDSPFPPSSGINRFRGNTAMTEGNGFDMTLQSKIHSGSIKWEPVLLFSYVQDKVKRYLSTFSASSYLSGVNPAEGKPLYSFYSYRWGGLDPQTGDPQGYLDGQISKDYAKILSGANRDNMVYSGPSRPPVFGSLGNTISWKQLSLSANMSVRLGYFYRKNSVNYNNNDGLGTNGQFDQRWQKPGDEQFTQIPSVPLSANISRDNLYLNSDLLVERGDHVRLQDIHLSYDLSASQLRKLHLNRMTFYIYVNNIAVLWKAAKGNIDPDYPTAANPPVRSIATGIKMDF